MIFYMTFFQDPHAISVTNRRVGLLSRAPGH